MSFRNTIIALVLFAIVGAIAIVNYLYMVDEPARKLYDLKPEDITAIELRYPDRVIEITRQQDGGWLITKPYGLSADKTAAENLARAIAECEVQRTVEEKAEDLAPFGLADPQVIVTVTTSDSKTWPGIVVGKTTPIGFSTYIKTTDKAAVMLTGAAFQSGMNKTVDQLRNRDLMDVKLDDVRRFTIERGDGETIEVVRDGDVWQIAKPKTFAADPAAVRAYLSTLINAKVADFIEDTPVSVAQYGLDRPRMTVTLYTGDDAQVHHSLLLGFKETGEGKSGYYARRGERTSVYTIHGYVMQALDKTLLDLRDKTVLAFDPAKLQTVKVEGSAGKFELARGADGNWTVIENGKATEANQGIVQRYVEIIHNLKGVSIVADPMPSPTPFGLDPPKVVVTLIGKDGAELGVLKLGEITIENPGPVMPGEPQGPRNEYYAASTAGRAVFSLPDFTFMQLDRKALHFFAPAAAAEAQRKAAREKP